MKKIMNKEGKTAVQGFEEKLIATINRSTPSRPSLLLFPSGAADAEEALRKRQERYRQELEEQIADQQRRKRRWGRSCRDVVAV